MKRVVKVWYLVLTLVLLCSCVPVEAKAGTQIRLNKTNVTLVQGESVRLTVSGTRKSLRWSSSNTVIAVVSSNGIVTAKKKGRATITGRVGNKKLHCRVTVRAKEKNTSRDKRKTQAQSRREFADYILEHGEYDDEGNKALIWEKNDLSALITEEIAYDASEDELQFSMSFGSKREEDGYGITVLICSVPVNENKSNVSWSFEINDEDLEEIGTVMAFSTDVTLSSIKSEKNHLDWILLNPSGLLSYEDEDDLLELADTVVDTWYTMTNYLCSIKAPGYDLASLGFGM